MCFLETTTIRNLKNILQRLTNVPAREQQLMFKLSEEDTQQELELEDDLRDLSFYNIDQACLLYVWRK